MFLLFSRKSSRPNPVNVDVQYLWNCTLGLDPTSCCDVNVLGPCHGRFLEEGYTSKDTSIARGCSWWSRCRCAMFNIYASFRAIAFRAIVHDSPWEEPTVVLRFSSKSQVPGAKWSNACIPKVHKFGSFGIGTSLNTGQLDMTVPLKTKWLGLRTGHSK